ncbi:MAG: hypothetical protein K0S27_7 [Gammaproteobacteria bacterium]|nr:hypothetical protein [Gammaproteobacteria bacterium]
MEISFFPLFFTVMWLLKNTQLPASDAASYLLTAIEHHKHFEHRGFWSCAYSCYVHRGWRPIFFPVLLSPFLIISFGNLLIGVGLFALSCVVATVIYVYLLLRLQLDRLSAIVVTNLIGLLPLLQTQIVEFYAESALFPCIIGGVYHLIQSNYFRHRKHAISFAICLTLAIIIRPVEAVTHLIFVLGLFFFLGCYKRILNVKQIIVVLTLASAALSVFLAACLWNPTQFIDMRMTMLLHYLFISAVVSTLFFYLVFALLSIKKNKVVIKANVVPVFFISFLLVILWFFPYASKTAEWIYRTSIGDVAMATTRLVSQKFPIWAELVLQTDAEGRMIVLGAALLAIAGGVLACMQHQPKVFYSLPVIYLLLVIPFPLFEVLFTVQDINRKLSIAFPALIMAMLIVGLYKGSFWVVRFSSAVLLLIGQFSLLMVGTFSKVPFDPFLKNMMGYSMPRPITIYPNPHGIVEKFLTNQAKKYQLRNIAIAVNPNTVGPIDPFLLSTMVHASKNAYSVPYAYFSTFSPANPLKLSHNKEVDALFLSDASENMGISMLAASAYSKKYASEKNPSLKTFYEFLLFYSQNKLSDIGWKLGPCIMIKSPSPADGLKKMDYLGCLLLPQ